MAFSYSDKNFTVIGNLCFVHILLDGTEKIIDIPPAIKDRMLYDEYDCFYPYLPVGTSVGIPNVGYAYTDCDGINCVNPGTGYLSFYFPIDSNK